jgi:hypothetical protein
MNLEVAEVVDLLAEVLGAEVVAEELVEVEAEGLLVGATLEGGLARVTRRYCVTTAGSQDTHLLSVGRNVVCVVTQGISQQHAG